jgi:hypothetical protein
MIVRQKKRKNKKERMISILKMKELVWVMGKASKM